jgi:hypothetical protein
MLFNNAGTKLLALELQAAETIRATRRFRPRVS